MKPESYKKLCEIKDVYLRLYPIPKDESVSEDDVEAEVMDDEMPSGAAPKEQKVTVIQHRTNVVQNGENNFNLTNNGTMNFNL